MCKYFSSNSKCCVYSKDELKQRIWTNEQNSDNIVQMYMTFLQEKFNALNANIKINDIDGYKLEKMI